MASINLYFQNNKILVMENGEGVRMTIPEREMIDGAVFNLSDGICSTLRLWVKGGKIYILRLQAFDIRWPHDVYIFSNYTERDAVEIVPIEKFLARGEGIPAA